jgi:hypothetical protein
MDKKQKTKGELLREKSRELARDYERWKDIYENGCPDPGWPDGTNLNLKRVHVLVSKRGLESLLGDDWALYPDCYFFPTPPEMPKAFMAKDRALPGNCAEVAGEMRPCGHCSGEEREIFHAFATPGKLPYREIMRGRPLEEYLREIPGLV